MHSNKSSDEPSKRTAKDLSISHIKQTTANLLKIHTDSILILQFGSAFFKADDLLSSDFDIVLVLMFHSIKDTLSLTTTEEMRDQFFFKTLARALRTEHILVYPVQQARNPILKICFNHDKTQLWVDLSFSIVANT